MIRSTRCRSACTRGRTPRVAGCLFAALASFAASTAIATPAIAEDAAPDPAALALFRRGRELVAHGEWAEGCAKLHQSFERSASASTLLNIARCDEHDGKVATAWTRNHQALALAGRLTDPGRRTELIDLAKDGVARMEARLPKVLVDVSSPPRDASAADETGRALPIGEAVPLDPGRHTVTVRASGFVSQTVDVVLDEARTSAIRVALVPDGRAFPAPAAPTGAIGTPATDPGRDRQPPAGATAPKVNVDDPTASAGRPFPWLAAGVGTLGLALGGTAVGFALDSASATSDLRARCGEDLVCNEDASFDPDPLNDRKNRGLGLAIGLGAAGAIAIGVAIWLFVDSRAGGRTALAPGKNGVVTRF